ncbi:cellulose biosynthesis cyclic di-GMP-binding regulatory protein BcsB, partial [Clostridiaceae bacterium UIB06]|nr:cellulose biosynthesis cyclic di-GMP-binding regulatory protein BcsB [Clostridiaceae bacterium UIB06]
FRGVFSSHSLYFQLDKYVKAQSLNADIFFNVSQLVSDKVNATITFSVNGTSVSSSKIMYKADEATQNIKVNIPVSLLKEGMNEFKIDTYCRISDDQCSDDVNNGNWITLQGKSNLSMGFIDKESTNNISEFTYPFIKLNEEDKFNAVIAIPDNYNQEELSAALMLQAYLGKMNKSGDYNGIVVKYSAIKDDKDIIYIGGISNLPEKLKTLYSGILQEDYKNNAIIKKGSSPFNEKYKLMSVISENGDMLTKAVKLLMNENLVSQLNVDTFKVDKNTKVENDLSEDSTNLTFKDLGLQEMHLKGPFRQSGSLSYSLPRNRVLSSGAKIKLFTRYSQNLDFNRALLTVYINGTPIGSKKLDKDKCNGDQLELPIPKDIQMSNYMDIKITFDLEQANTNCQFRQEEMPWALVTGDSYVYLPNNKVDFYKFDTYPQPFISDKQFNNVALVVPENLSENEVEGISKVFSYMGRDLGYNNGNLKVIEEKNFSSKYHNMNLIVYGTPQKNKVIKELNSKLWFKYNKDYNSFEGNEKLYLTGPYASNIATFQFDISPYNKGKAILVMTSPKEDVLLKSLKFLSETKYNSKLSGDSVLVDNYGNIKTFKFKKEDTKSLHDKFNTVETSTKVFVGFIGLFFIFIAVAVTLYYFKNKGLNR